MSTLSLGFSPCPNDTYMFDALLHHLKHPYNYKMFLGDIEELNQLAFQTKLDITKLSINGFFHASQNYQLLETGAALGKGCGPLVVSRNKTLSPNSLVALPGSNTTANLLFNLQAKENNTSYTIKQMPFNHILTAVSEGKVDFGVIIHESRFTYKEKGLHVVLDLGQWWEQATSLPLPLGGIAIKKSLPTEIKEYTTKAIRDSIDYAKEHPKAALPFIAEQAQEISEQVQQQHIDLYVNEYSYSLGEIGKQAIQEMYSRAVNAGLLSANVSNLKKLFDTV